MDLLEKDIQQGLIFLKGEERIFSTASYDLLFRFTNEALSLYYQDLKIKGGKVLTVTGSGDHLLQAILNGAKEITFFDQNRFTYYYTLLKIAAIKGLDCLPFKLYFDVFSPLEFSYNIFDTFKDYLPQDAYDFWKAMYKAGFEKKNTYLIGPGINANIGENAYLEEEHFRTLKARIHNVSYRFIDSRLEDLASNLTNQDQFDTVLLSNIFDWLGNDFNPYLEKKYIALIQQTIEPYMKKQGQCVLYASPCNLTVSNISFDKINSNIQKKVYPNAYYTNDEVVYTYTKK